MTSSEFPLSPHEPHASAWSEPVAQEWCSIHRLIEELSLVQRRIGTPLERPEDLFRVRELGSDIRGKLDQLGEIVEEVLG